MGWSLIQIMHLRNRREKTEAEAMNAKLSVFIL